MIKVVTITSLVEGGAGIAAFRLHQSLIHCNCIDSTLIQKNPLYDPSVKKLGINRSIPSFSFLYKILCKLHLTPYLTVEGKYLKEIAKYPKTYEEISIPVSYYRIEEHPLVKNADIIHLHWVSNFLDYTTFFKNIKQPIVWTLHDMNAFQGLFHYEDDKQRNFETFGKLDKKTEQLKIKSIHKHDNINIVSPSHWLKNKSERSKALGKYPHSVILNGIDFSTYKDIDRLEAKKKLKINQDSLSFFFIADNINVRRKGLDIVLDAFNTIKGYKLNLITLGDGAIDFKNENITHYHFNRTTDRDIINTLYTAADYTILPSREDNLPNVMLESFANGTPVVSFYNGGMAEHIITNVNGILIEKINKDELAKCIIDILNNKYEFDNSAIKNYAYKTFNVETESKHYFDLYKKILNQQ